MKNVIYIVVFVAIFLNNSYAYSDLSKEHWAYEAIDNMSNSKILSGYPDGKFKPDNATTRSEFIMMLMKTIEPNTDVSSNTDYWADGAIKLAKELDILRINEYKNFAPDESITRYEICLMLYRSIRGTENVDIHSIKKFIDIDNRSLEELKIANILNYLGIINGYPDSTIRFDNTATRAEVCSIIDNYLKNRCKVISILNESENVLYKNDIAIINESELPSNLKCWDYSQDVPYITTKINKVSLFPFNEPIDEYKGIFDKIYTEDDVYLKYRAKFGENNYIIAVQFDTINNTYNHEVYAGHEFFRLCFEEENIEIIDAFDTDEMRRQLNDDGTVGELVLPGETHHTSAFYVVNKLPDNEIRFDRDVTGLFNIKTNQYDKVTSFHSLIVQLNR